jgi:hypothetical protein
MIQGYQRYQLEIPRMSCSYDLSPILLVSAQSICMYLLARHHYKLFSTSLQFRTIGRNMETKSTKESAMAQVRGPHTDEGTTEIYIDPIKEARMMRKFDVRRPVLPHNIVISDQLMQMHAVLRNRLAGIVLHDGQPGPEQYRKCSNRRNARRPGLGG